MFYRHMHTRAYMNKKHTQIYMCGCMCVLKHPVILLILPEIKKNNDNTFFFFFPRSGHFTVINKLASQSIL